MRYHVIQDGPSYRVLDTMLRRVDGRIRYKDKTTAEARANLLEQRMHSSVLQVIADVLSRTQWTPDTLDTVAGILRRAGFPVHDSHLRIGETNEEATARGVQRTHRT